MKSRRLMLTGVSVFIVSTLLFNFQNCAPAGGMSSNSGQSSSVHLIEDMNKSQIEFAQSSVEVRDGVSSTTVSGICARQHDGAKLQWTVYAGQQAVASGNGACQSGQFALGMADLQDMVCGTDHILVVEGDWGGSTYTHFKKRCEPLASESVAPPAGSPYGTACEMDYDAATEADSRCTQVCYRDDKVVSSVAVDVNQCSAIAAQLAGQ